MRGDWALEHLRAGEFGALATNVGARLRCRWRRSLLHPGVARNAARYVLHPGAHWTPGPLNVGAVVDQLRAAGVDVAPFRIDVEGLQQYLAHASYPPRYYADAAGGHDAVFIEKALEHHVSLCLLEPRPGDVVLDIASSSSPFAEIAMRMFDVTVYAQDLEFPAGMVAPAPGSPGRIGGNAAALPLPDASVSGMVLHCAFEMFQGDDDGRLIAEAGRVLRPGGRLIILPLYLHQDYFIERDPLANLTDVVPEPGARIYYKRDYYRVAFSRHYDPRAFERRVMPFLGALNLKVLVVENEKDVGAACYLKFIAVFQRPHLGR